MIHPITPLRNLAISLSLSALLPASLSAAIIFQDDFNGGSADLDGAAPDTGTGTWTATPIFDQNGNINITDVATSGVTSNFGAGSATLAFAPTNGLVYTLDGSVTLSTGGAGDWVAFGFANGQSTDQSASNRFIGGTTEGRAWMYLRENTNNPAAALTALTDSTGWTGFANSPNDVDLRILLDTTGGAGTWSATWYAKESSSGSYTKIRDTATLADEDITSVGFAISGDTVTADITNFSLTSEIPEPSSTALLGLSGLAFILRRRR